MKIFGKHIFKKTPKVPVIRLSGVIGAAGPGRRGLTLDGLARDIERAFDVKHAKAIALEINSPGGSPVQSALIAGRIRQLADEKELPIHAFCEDAAASGGYWLACAADEIHAMPASIVGSIGVISAGFGLEGVLEKLGAERRVHTAGKDKGMLDPFQPEKPKDIQHLKKLQADMHDQFVTWVKERRGDRLKSDEHKNLFEGGFWTGRQSMEMGLIDSLSDTRSKMRELYGDKVKFIPVIRKKGRLARLMGAESSVGAAMEGLVATLEERSWWQRIGL